MRKSKVALDVDGVIANFYLAMCRRFGMDYETIDCWGVKWLAEKFDEVDDDEFLDALPNMNRPDAITFDFDCYITAIPEKHKESRIAWLAKHGYPEKPVYIAFDKAECMKRHNIDIIIDDKYENVKAVEDAGLKAIHYVPDYLFPRIEQTHVSSRTIKHLSEAKIVIIGIDNEKMLREKGMWVETKVD